MKKPRKEDFVSDSGYMEALEEYSEYASNVMRSLFVRLDKRSLIHLLVGIGFSTDIDELELMGESELWKTYIMCKKSTEVIGVKEVINY